MKRNNVAVLFLAGCVWSGLSLMLAGCQKADAPPLVRVTGEVVNGNSPVEGAWIEFHPAHGRSSSGMTDAQGRFQLRYTIEHEGALPGEHTVHFHLPPQKAPNVPEHYNEAERKEFLERHREPVKIPYEEQVTVSKDVNQFRFDLTTKVRP